MFLVAFQREATALIIAVIHTTPWRLMLGQSWCGGWQTDDDALRHGYGNRSFAAPNRDQDSDGQ